MPIKGTTSIQHLALNYQWSYFYPFPPSLLGLARLLLVVGCVGLLGLFTKSTPAQGNKRDKYPPRTYRRQRDIPAARQR